MSPGQATRLAAVCLPTEQPGGRVFRAPHPTRHARLVSPRRLTRACWVRCSHSDWQARAGELVNLLRAADQPVPPAILKFGCTVKKKEHKLYGAHSRAKGGPITKKATKITFDDSDED